MSRNPRPIDVAPPALRAAVDATRIAFEADPTEEKWERFRSAVLACINYRDATLGRPAVA